MVARTVPRTAHIADDLSLPHLLSGCDTDAGTVGVQDVYKRQVWNGLFAFGSLAGGQFFHDLRVFFFG